MTVTGSLKFDSLEMPGPVVADRGPNRVLRFFRVSPDRPVVIAASTLKGEEETVLEAFQRIRALWGNALLIIAPRKPERFDEVERLAQQPGWRVARRSDLAVDSEPRVDVVILNTIGELAQLYQVATVVFVGGSLVDAGGHNILEPAVFGKPIVFARTRTTSPRSPATSSEPAARSVQARELETCLSTASDRSSVRVRRRRARPARLIAAPGRTIAVSPNSEFRCAGTVLPFRAVERRRPLMPVRFHAGCQRDDRSGHGGPRKRNAGASGTLC